MGLFGFGKDNREEPRPSPLEEAKKEYRQRREQFDVHGNAIELKTQDGENWRLHCDAQAFYLFPVLDVSLIEDAELLRRAEEVCLPRETAVLEKCPTIPEQTGEDGLFRYFRKPEISLTLEGPRFPRQILTARNADKAAKWLAENELASVLPIYDLFDCTPPLCEVTCADPDNLFPQKIGRLRVFRTAEELVFLSEPSGLYGGTSSDFGIGRLPAGAVRFYQLRGGVRAETRVTGGQVTIDRSGALWGGTLSLNPNAAMLENAISTTPIRTEQIEHDERYVELRINWQGKRHKLRFSSDSLAAFNALIPDKDFDETVFRAPTAAEQLASLADLCERGYLTRAEFDAIKQKLLREIGT